MLTSNYSPRNLLPDPEFHERFEPTIERIEQHFEIVAFDGERDYREHHHAGGTTAAEQRFFAPLEGTREPLRALFGEYEAHAGTATAEVAGRALPVTAADTQLVWVDFDALCGTPRSHLDHLACSRTAMRSASCVNICPRPRIRRLASAARAHADR